MTTSALDSQDMYYDVSEGPVVAGVPTDGPARMYVPDRAEHFVALGLPVPDFLWLCQDTGGSLVPSIGNPAATMAPSAGTVYAASLPGWKRTFVGTTDGVVGARFVATHTSLDIAAGESMAVVAFASITATTGNRVLVAQGYQNSLSLGGDNQLYAYHNNQIVLISGGNHDDAAHVRPLVWYRDCAKNQSGAVTDRGQAISSVHSELAWAGSGHGIGNGGEPVAGTRFGWFAIYKGANAEGYDWTAYVARISQGTYEQGTNLRISPAGDWLLCSGREALRQALIRRIMTDPGEWQTLPAYGVGARQFVKERDTQPARDQLIARIRAQMLRDQRVARVENVSVTRTADGLLTVGVTVRPVARPIDGGDLLAFQLEVA